MNSACCTPLHRQAFELDGVTFGVQEIDGGAPALGAVARFRGPDLDVVLIEVFADGGLVESIDAHTEVVHVVSVFSWRDKGS